MTATYGTWALHIFKKYLLKSFQNVPKCTKMYQNVPKCTKIYQNVPKWGGAYYEDIPPGNPGTKYVSERETKTFYFLAISKFESHAFVPMFFTYIQGVVRHINTYKVGSLPQVHRISPHLA
jgi:hypothetical protein